MRGYRRASVRVYGWTSVQVYGRTPYITTVTYALLVEAMLPEAIEPLRGKAAAELLEYDKRPLTGPEKESLQAADAVYSKHKVP